MTPPAWGIPLVLVLGVAVVALGWWWDRRRNRLESKALERPPGRPIPGLPATDADPGYVTEADILALAVPDAGPEADALVDRREAAAPLPGGTVNTRFLNVESRGCAALPDPLVLVTDAVVTAQRVVVTVLDAARRQGRPLVWVAPGFSDEVVGTLRANAIAGGHRVLPIALPNSTALRRAAAMTGARVLPGADLLADWLPAEAWGRCAGWVADREHSWVILDAERPAS